MVNFEKSVDENNENNSTLDNFTIGKYSLESNCNNELTYFQFDKMPSCIRNECDKLLCKPLKDLNIDVSKIDKKLVKLGEGAFNDVFDITYDDDTPIVLRLLKIQRTNKKNHCSRTKWSCLSNAYIEVDKRRRLWLPLYCQST